MILHQEGTRDKDRAVFLDEGYDVFKLFTVRAGVAFMLVVFLLLLGECKMERVKYVCRWAVIRPQRREEGKF